ncbi:MAG: formate dehydrogenase accessory sulfurtransferase FdhD [Ferruginibacter sp.]|nr:formate dehydrogenase accessory sulfurtransferase FdhD [Ferruginibacter sp.]
MNDKRTEQVTIHKVINTEMNEATDKVAAEGPLQIQLQYSTATGQMLKDIAVTMRTPGNDEELAAGFLFTEGIIKQAGDIASIKRPPADENIIQVTLKENVVPELKNSSRNFYTTSSCGVCGKASIDAINTVSSFTDCKDNIFVDAAILYKLPESIKAEQKVFEDTGGIHASALFDVAGKVRLLREDVGRHNALDKLIGEALMNNKLPLNNQILFLSGRASFELVQKAVMAGIRFIAAVGAPSSLAVEMAKDNSITLIGFLKNNRFNIYSGKERISL